MTLEKIKKSIEKIEESSDDPESAHSQEDQLYYDFIKFVSKYDPNHDIAKMAKEVLKTEKIDFTRWCA